jgi:acyl transferase domain-containing protein/acyl carrier protein
MDTTINASDIAIVGLAGRFPGAETPEQLWANLRGGVESITTFDRESCERSAIDPGLEHDAHLVGAAGVLKDIEAFDAELFGFTPQEAALTDPQHRIFLECALEALERAGYDPDQCNGTIGVYASTTMSRYLHRCLSPAIVRAHGIDRIAMGNNVDFLTTLVSYKLNLTGPSYGVQSACSSSLVAVHVASQALRAYECDLALAGGVAIRVPQRTGYRYEDGSLFSPDHHCRPFDADAQGTVFGNGAGVVVLQRLADAIACGSRIHAVIKGSAINNDGSHKVGFTAPSVAGQSTVIAEAHANAAVPVDTIEYVEAHGTGTAVGDPIEVAALTDAFRRATAGRRFCALGSVKSNVGHLDAAAGVVGLIKTALALQHREIPPTLHFRSPNPRIDFDASPFFVNATPRPWNGDGVRRAGVSSFGVGGTNAHVVVEEAPRLELGAGARPVQLLTVSARTAAALDRATSALVDAVRDLDGESLADAAYTGQIGRRAHRYRRAIVCQRGADAEQAWRHHEAASVVRGEASTRAPELVFVFGGQGGGNLLAAADLYATETLFRREIDRSVDILEAYAPGTDWRSVILNRAGSEALLKHTRILQPALFAFELAVAKMWVAWVGEPAALLGHSLGEYVAACLSGVMTLEQALPLLVERAVLMQSTPSGKMLVAAIGEAEVPRWLDDRLDLAAVNAPDRCVLAGEPDAIDELAARLGRAGVWTRELRVDRAFHSRRMEPALARFQAVLDRHRFAPPRIPIVSSVTGRWLSAADAQSSGYWARQLLQPVRFNSALEMLGSRRLYVEFVAASLLDYVERQHDYRVLSAVPPSAGAVPIGTGILFSLARLWTQGVAVSWKDVYAGQRRHRVVLPTYPFERSRHWIDEPAPADDRGTTAGPVAKRAFEHWFYVPSWKRVPPALSRDAASAAAVMWVVFDEGLGLGAGVAARLAPSASRVVRVERGREFSRQSASVYTVSPDSSSDYLRVFDDLDLASSNAVSIVHCWGLRSAGEDDLAAHEAEQLRSGCLSVLWAGQAIERRRTAGEVSLFVVTSAAHDVTGGERALPATAAILGPCTVIPQECAGVRCRHIDVPRVDAAASWVDAVISELLLREGPSLVAYRDRSRWVPTVESILPPAPATPPELDRKGAYLLIGGLGRFGLIAARYLARRSGAPLVLTSRSPLPERAQWDDWLATHPAGDVTSQRIVALRSIAALGPEPTVVRLDAADARGVTALVTRIEREHGRLAGVIHAAGHTGEETHRGIHELTDADVEQVFSPKVTGLRVLADALTAASPDFVLLTSSLSPLLGGLGLAAYSAAHCYMDAFAARMRAYGRPWTSVNWEGWAREPSQRHDADLGGEIARLTLTDDEIERAFDVVLHYGTLPRIVIATGDLERRMREWVGPQALARTAAALPAARTTSPAAAGDDRGVAALTPAEITDRVLAVAASVLGIGDLGPEDNVFDRGANSLSAIQMLSRLRHEFQRPIPLSDLFANPSAAALARALADRFNAPADSDLDVPQAAASDDGCAVAVAVTPR